MSKIAIYQILANIYIDFIEF